MGLMWVRVLVVVGMMRLLAALGGTQRALSDAGAGFTLQTVLTGKGDGGRLTATRHTQYTLLMLLLSVDRLLPTMETGYLWLQVTDGLKGEPLLLLEMELLL